MAINSGRIAAGHTETRASTKINCVHITNTVPPQGYVGKNPDTNLLEFVEQPAEREGQLLVYNVQNETTLYVVVNISGTLTWKKATAITGYIDTTTGKPFGL